MIDPVRFTNYNLDDQGLQEYILFAISAAGKNATTAARILDEFLNHAKETTGGKDHFDCVLKIAKDKSLPSVLKSFGFGCFNLKGQGFLEIAQSGLDLKSCSVVDLEKIKGIGMKTSRFFVMHTRRNAGVACLDVHILRWMKKRGFKNIPQQTPTGKRYLEIEKKFLDVAKRLNKEVATLDLAIWNDERGSFDS